MARIGKQEHPRTLQMVDTEHRKVAEVAAEYGSTPADIYALLGKLRREASRIVKTAGAIQNAAKKTSAYPPLTVSQPQHPWNPSLAFAKPEVRCPSGCDNRLDQRCLQADPPTPRSRNETTPLASVPPPKFLRRAAAQRGRAVKRGRIRLANG